MFRRRLGRAEWVYAGLVVLFYAAFTLTTNKNPHVGEWFTVALWIFFIAGASRFAVDRWAGPTRRWSPQAVALVAAYAVIVYALGAYALVSWPSNEKSANAQLTAVTSELAGELRQHVAAGHEPVSRLVQPPHLAKRNWQFQGNTAFGSKVFGTCCKNVAECGRYRRKTRHIGRLGCLSQQVQEDL